MPSFLWLSQTEAVGLGWLQTLGFSFKAQEREKEKKITVKNEKGKELCQECTGKKQHIRFVPSARLFVFLSRSITKYWDQIQDMNAIQSKPQ